MDEMASPKVIPDQGRSDAPAHTQARVSIIGDMAKEVTKMTKILSRLSSFI